MDRPPPYVRRTLLQVVLALVSCYGGFVVAGIVGELAGPSKAPAALLVAGLLFLAAARLPTKSDDLPAAGSAARALTIAGGAGAMVAMASLSLSWPIVDHSTPEGARAFTWALIGALAVLAAGTWLAARAARRADGRTASPSLRRAAAAVIIVEAVLAAISFASRRPSPDTYVSSLPVVVTVPRALRDRDDGTYVAGDLAFHSSCTMTMCAISVAPIWDRDRRVEPVRLELPRGFFLRRDEARDLWVLDGSAGKAPFLGHERGRVAAFRGPDLARAAIRPRDLVGSLGAPRGWAILAAIGAALASARLWQRRREQRALDDLASAEDGALDDAGWITLASGGNPVRAPQGLAIGPVVVVRPAAAAGSAYRVEGALSAERVLEGTRADRIDRAHRTIAALDARALSIALVTSAPLLTAWIMGLR